MCARGGALQVVAHLGAWRAVPAALLGPRLFSACPAPGFCGAVRWLRWQGVAVSMGAELVRPKPRPRQTGRPSAVRIKSGRRK